MLALGRYGGLPHRPMLHGCPADSGHCMGSHVTQLLSVGCGGLHHGELVTQSGLSIMASW